MYRIGLFFSTINNEDRLSPTRSPGYAVRVVTNPACFLLKTFGNLTFKQRPRQASNFVYRQFNVILGSSNIITDFKVPRKHHYGEFSSNA